MKSFKIVALIVTIALCFSGCVSTQNLKDLDVVEGAAIDYKDNKFNVTIQTLNLTKTGSGAEGLSGNITKNNTGSGDTVSTAVSDCSKMLSKKLFFGHNSIIILGKGIIDENIEKSLDYLLRSVDSRPDLIVAMSEKEGSEILNCTQNDSLVPAETVTSLIRVGEKAGLGTFTTVSDLMNAYSFPTSDIALTMLKVKKDKKNCEISGISIFSEDEYKTTLSKNESMGLLFINDKISAGTISFNSKKFGNVGVEITNSNTKVKVYEKNGEVYADINIETKLMIDEIEKGYLINLTQDEFLQMKKLCEKEIDGYCKSAVTTAFANGCDVFDFGKRLAGSNKEYFDSVKKDWRKNLQSINVNVKSNCTVEKVNGSSVRD